MPVLHVVQSVSQTCIFACVTQMPFGPTNNWVLRNILVWNYLRHIRSVVKKINIYEIKFGESFSFVILVPTR